MEASSGPVDAAPAMDPIPPATPSTPPAQPAKGAAPGDEVARTPRIRRRSSLGGSELAALGSSRPAEVADPPWVRDAAERQGQEIEAKIRQATAEARQRRAEEAAARAPAWVRRSAAGTSGL